MDRHRSWPSATPRRSISRRQAASLHREDRPLLEGDAGQGHHRRRDQAGGNHALPRTPRAPTAIARWSCRVRRSSITGRARPRGVLRRRRSGAGLAAPRTVTFLRQCGHQAQRHRRRYHGTRL